MLRGTFATGGAHSLSFHTVGSLWATGLNYNGQLGTGTTDNTTTWVQVGTVKDWAQVAAGRYFSLALKANGTIFA